MRNEGNSTPLTELNTKKPRHLSWLFIRTQRSPIIELIFARFREVKRFHFTLKYGLNFTFVVVFRK